MLDAADRPDPRAGREPHRPRSSRPPATSRSAPASYWSEWSRTLSIPFEWQEAVIRAAITLKLCTLRGHRRDRRRAHDLDPRGAGQRAQLGLPLLLAPRLLLRRPRAQPARRDEDDGGLPALDREHRGRRGRPAPARLRRRARGAPRGALRAEPRRLPRDGPGADRQPGLRAAAARRLREHRPRLDAVVLRPAPAASRRAPALRAARARRRAGAARSGTGPTRALGAPRPRTTCTRSRP